MNKKVLLVAIAAVAIISIFAVSYYQYSQPVPPRCDLAYGVCATDCNGSNFEEPLKRFDCAEGLICCLS